MVRKGTTAKLASPVAPDADDQQTLRDVVELLSRDAEGTRRKRCGISKSRGLTHPEMIGHFKLGFANRKLGLTLPDKNRKAGADLRGRLQRLGILRAESGHEHMNGSVVFPIFDLAGERARHVWAQDHANLRAGTPLHLYLPGPHRGVWNEEALRGIERDHSVRVDHRRADVLVRGVPQRDGQLRRERLHGRSPGRRFRSTAIEQVWIAYDRDDAGDAAAERLKEELLASSASDRIACCFRQGMDANEYALKSRREPGGAAEQRRMVA